MVLSPALIDLVDTVDAQLKRIEGMLNVSMQRGAEFYEDFAALNMRLEDVRRGKAE